MQSEEQHKEKRQVLECVWILMDLGLELEGMKIN